MPNCIQLTPIGYAEPATFQRIDDAICQNLDLPWDKTHWAYGWYDVIGFRLALGQTFPQITDSFRESIAKLPDSADYYRMLIRIVHYLMQSYTADAWYETKR